MAYARLVLPIDADVLASFTASPYAFSRTLFLVGNPFFGLKPLCLGGAVSQLVSYVTKPDRLAKSLLIKEPRRPLACSRLLTPSRRLRGESSLSDFESADTRSR